MTQFFNKSSMKKRRQILRWTMTQTEWTLWSRLRRKQIDNLRFRRQYSVGNFVLDFFCPEIKLDIELDGEIHEQWITQEYDHYRDEQMRNLGITVLRFANHDITGNLDIVLRRIRDTGVKLRAIQPRK